MAESSWPAASTSRIIDDNQYEQLGSAWGWDGLQRTLGASAAIYADSSGLQVKCQASIKGTLRGHGWTSGTSTVTVPINANTSGSTRVDLVVVRLDRSDWSTSLHVIDGVPGAGTCPNPVQDTGTTGYWDMPMATVTVLNGASTIAAGNVTDVSPVLIPGGGAACRSQAALELAAQHPGEGHTAYVSGLGNCTYTGSLWVPCNGPWVDYSASFVLASDGTQPTLGNSTVDARYQRSWNTIEADITILIGSTFSAGTGIYLFKAPVAPRSQYCMLTSYITDYTTLERTPYGGRFSPIPGNYLLVNNSIQWVMYNYPQTWVAGDSISISARYEAA